MQLLYPAVTSDAKKSVLIVVQQHIRKYLIGLCRSPFSSLSHLKDIPWDMKSAGL